MKYILAALFIALTCISCKKNTTETGNATPEDIQVIVVATPAYDTTITATTNIIRIKLK